MARLFSEREIRAVAVFLPLAGLLVAALVLVRPKADPEAARRAEAAMEERRDSVELHPFDPNTADFEELLGLGLSKYEAVSLLKFRAAGKVFRIPEDVALCYGIGDSLYRRLAPWIRIGRRYAIAPRTYRPGRILPEPLAPSPFRIDTVSARYLRAIGALSKRQAEAFVRWRDLSGIRDMEELRACYVVSDSVAAALEPYVIFPERQPRPIDRPVEPEHGRFGGAAVGHGHRREDRHADHPLPRTARRIPQCGATRRDSGGHGEQLRKKF